MHGRGKLTLVPSNKFSLLYLSGEIHKRYTSEEILLCLKATWLVLTVLKVTPQLCCIPRFLSTCCPRHPINLCSRQRDIMAQIHCMAVCVFEFRKNCQTTNRKPIRNSVPKYRPASFPAVHTIPFSRQAFRKWKIHTVAVIIKSHKKGIRVLATENVCNVAEFSRQRASITASVRAAKIRCHGGKDPILLTLNRTTLHKYHH